MNLRRKVQPDYRKFLFNKGDLVENNHYICIDDPSKPINIVRRPHSSYNYNKRKSDNVAKQKFWKVESLNYKIRENVTIKDGSRSNRLANAQGLINITKSEKNIICDRTSTDDLMVEGKNKLKSEIEAAKKKDDLLLYKELAQLETQFIDTVEEEVIAIDYDKKMYL